MDSPSRELSYWGERKKKKCVGGEVQGHCQVSYIGDVTCREFEQESKACANQAGVPF